MEEQEIVSRNTQPQAEYLFEHQNIILQNKIGRGCQGSVYIGYNIKTNQRYAIKVINMGKMQQKQRQRLNCQINSNFTLSRLCNYDQFPYFYGYWIKQSQIFLVFQLCQGNALQGIRSNRAHAASYSFAYILLFDILKGLNLLQQKNIIHRDLKPENMLLDRGKFKICDLGLSKIAEIGKKLTIDVGNLMSRSPQSYGQVYDCRTDVWSLGINAYWIAFGTLPFDQEIKELLTENNIIEIKERISHMNFKVLLGPIHTNLLYILIDMLEINFTKRLSAEQLLKKYFSQNFQKFPTHSSIEIQMKQIFYLYLNHRKERQLSCLLLSLFLLTIQNEKVNEYLKNQKSNIEKVQNSKNQICRRVKINIFLILKYIYTHFQNSQNQVVPLLAFYLDKWEAQLAQNQQNKSKLNKRLKKIQEGLKMHQIESIRQRFPLVIDAVNIFKEINTQKQICLWEIKHLDLRLFKI